MFIKKMKANNKPAAQAMAEFALVLPILLLVVYGLLEVGRLLFIFASVNTASRQAVRYGSAIGLVDTNGDGSLDTQHYRDCNGILAEANRVAFITDFTNVNITYDRGIDGSGNPVPITNPLTINPDPEVASSNTCTLVYSLSQDPIQNGDRISVYVSAFFAPVIPFIPLDPLQIESAASRTIVGEIPIEVTAVPAAWGGAGGGSYSLDLAITASPETYDTLGQVITYTYTLSNSGANSLTSPYSISDNTVGSISCAGATSPLAPGASTTCTGTYTITQADLDKGFVTNTATATAGATTSPSATATIIATQNPQVNLQVTPTPIIAFNQGTTVTYTFTLQNTGNVTLNGPFSITDDTLPAVNCSGAASPLAPGASTTCIGSYLITSGDIDDGFVTNFAIASCSQAISNLASATVVTKPLVLSISASPDTATAIGQVITYTYTLRNAGPVNLTSPYSISDDKVTTIDCSGASGSIAPNATTTCTGTYAITQADADAGSVTNHATATARYSGQTVTSNQASTSVLITALPKITLTISASPNPAQTLGTVVNYIYTIRNTGTLSLTAPFTITDSQYPTLVNCSGATSPLAPGATTTCTHSHTITQEDLNNGSITNTATVTANAGSNLVTSTPVYATVITNPFPRLTLEKTANPAIANSIGQTITYIYKLRNTGNTVLSAPFTVADNKVFVTCSPPASSIPVGGFVTCTANYTITTQDASAGSVVNTAIATAKNGAQTLPSNQATATVTVSIVTGCDPRHSEFKTNPFGFTIFNYGASTITISEIQVYFNNAQGNGLQTIELGGIPIWTGNESGSPATISNFSGDLTITPASSKLLEIKTKKTYQSNGTERLLVRFAEGGCVQLDSQNNGQLP
ncbi:MAG: pilus assembly protein [Anaerolineales bacterium]|nr:pilus assembly protein [Anaerolineales bacterium]